MAVICPRLGQPFIYYMASAIPVELKRKRPFRSRPVQRVLAAVEVRVSEWQFPAHSRWVGRVEVEKLRLQLGIQPQPQVLLYSETFAHQPLLDDGRAFMALLWMEPVRGLRPQYLCAVNGQRVPASAACGCLWLTGPRSRLSGRTSWLIRTRGCCRATLGFPAHQVVRITLLPFATHFHHADANHTGECGNPAQQHQGRSIQLSFPQLPARRVAA